ncbi:hypothetical protein P4B35_17740 [Pontiellaceae bacterium B12227]|nr:hypothetical protein [Pontiellaceae bacterium B12227]
MHPVSSLKHWSHHVSEHLHSRHFWAGVGVTLLVIGTVALLFVLIMKSVPVEIYDAAPYASPYMTF